MLTNGSASGEVRRRQTSADTAAAISAATSGSSAYGVKYQSIWLHHQQFRNKRLDKSTNMHTIINATPDCDNSACYNHNDWQSQK